MSIDESAKRRIDQLETCVKNQRKAIKSQHNAITKLLAEIEKFKEKLVEDKQIIRCHECQYGFQHDGEQYPKGDKYKGKWYCIVWGDGMQSDWIKPDGYCYKARLRGEE